MRPAQRQCASAGAGLRRRALSTSASIRVKDLHRRRQDTPGTQTTRLDGPFELDYGGTLPHVDVAWEQVRTLRSHPALGLADLSGGGSGATRRCPPSALSTSCPRSPTPATSSATSATPRPAGGKGWWGRGCACRHRRAPSRTVAHRRAAAGLGRYVDTNRFRVLSASNLGGPFGTTSPVSEEPGTGRPYRLRFPQITPGDVARVHHRLMQQVSASRHATRAMLLLLPRTFIAESPCGVGSSAGLGEGARGHRLQYGGYDRDSLRVYVSRSCLQAGGHGMHRSDISSAPPAHMIDAVLDAVLMTVCAAAGHSRAPACPAACNSGRPRVSRRRVRAGGRR